MRLPELTLSARKKVEEILREGHHVTFHVTRTKARRWNWLLTMRYTSQDQTTGQRTLIKVFLRTSKDRETLELLREQLEGHVQPLETQGRE
jgi:hypothetical protein